MSPSVSAPAPTTYPGVYPAKVYANNDPTNTGRIQMWIPQIFGSSPVRIWAPPLINASAPAVGSIVWCLFQGGDPSYPTYLPSPDEIPVAGIPPGGTTAQVLTKNSNTDYDASWATANRTYMSRATRNAAYTMPATANQEVNPFIYDNRTQGTAYNPTTGYYTCPAPGVYIVRATISMNLNTATSVTCNIYWSGARNANCNATNGLAGASAITAECVAIINANAGDTFNVGAQTSVASGLVRNVTTETFFVCALMGVM